MAKLTEKQALRAFHAVVKVLDERLAYDGKLVEATKDATPTEQGTGDQQWYAGPVLCRNFEGWSSATDWAIVWEGGDYEWAYMEAVSDAVTALGFWCEPYNTFALSLYREA
jgi:hypothetical protein